MVTENPQKFPAKFVCETCNVKCSHKGDWNKHLLTAKHINSINMIIHDNNLSQKIPEINEHICLCGKKYKYISGLSRHKKKCSELTTSSSEETMKPSADMFMILLNQNMELIKQNQEFKNLLSEQNKNMFEIANKIGNTTNIENRAQNNSQNSSLFL